MPDAVLEIAGVSKDYHGLRPLRIEQLTAAPTDRVALVGFDAPAAETFINLATGAALPDSGVVRAFGRSTADITDSADWLSVVDRFGIVSERAVLLDQLTVEQNLAMPFTLDVEPPPDDVRLRAAALAREVGLPDASRRQPVGAVDRASRTRIRLGRAIALDPAVLLLDHVSAGLDPRAAAQLGADIRAIAEARGIALVALTVDEAFARAVARRVLHWQAASGRLAERRGFFDRLLG